jgi:hypothetical protein
MIPRALPIHETRPMTVRTRWLTIDESGTAWSAKCQREMLRKPYVGSLTDSRFVAAALIFLPCLVLHISPEN